MDPENPYAPPSATVVTAPAEDPVRLEIRSLRTAGWLLVAGAVLNAFAMVALDATVVRSTYSSGWISILFDLWIGGSLAFDRFGVRTWAMVRAGLGALLFGAGAIAQGHVADGVVTLVSCAAILALVVPNPSRARLVAGRAAGIAVLLLATLALVLGATKR